MCMQIKQQDSSLRTVLFFICGIYCALAGAKPLPEHVALSIFSGAGYFLRLKNDLFLAGELILDFLDDQAQVTGV